jgi:hypothetical protein
VLPPVVLPPVVLPPLEPPPPLGDCWQHTFLSVDSHVVPSQKVRDASAIKLPDAPHTASISTAFMELQSMLGLQHVAASACFVHGLLWQRVEPAAAIKPFPKPLPASSMQKASSD